jgi:hypothetical protein
MGLHRSYGPGQRRQPCGTHELCAAAVMITVRASGITKGDFAASRMPRLLRGVERIVTASAGSAKAASKEAGRRSERGGADKVVRPKTMR